MDKSKLIKYMEFMENDINSVLILYLISRMEKTDNVTDKMAMLAAFGATILTEYENQHPQNLEDQLFSKVITKGNKDVD